MSAAAQLSFSFRVDEDFAAVCVEGIAVLTSPDANSLSGLLARPPTQNVMLGSGDQSAAGALPERGKNVASQPWNKWFVSVKQAFDKLSAALSNANGGLIVITAWSVRETDTAWYGLFTIDDVSTTVTPTLTGSSRFGQSLQAIAVTAGGDYDSAPNVVITDPAYKGGGASATAIMNGRVVQSIQISKYGGGFPSAPTISFTGGGGSGGATATATLYPFAPGQYFIVDDAVSTGGLWTYEICQIVSIDYGSGAWTITRGMFGTTPAGHTAMLFYLLVPGRFQKVLLDEVAPQCWKFLWPNMVVAIVQAQVLGGAPTQLTTFAADDGQGARPGLRTMSGAAYISLGIDGSITDGQNTNLADAGQSWETIRTQIAKVGTPPVTNPFVMLLCWIAPNGTDVGLLGTITIAATDSDSYDPVGDPPRNRQMPYLYSANDPIWPPVRLTRCNSAIDALTGDLLATMTFGDREVYFEPNGDIRGVVVTASGAADLRVTLET
jgi:hypothetical protein